MVQQVPGIVGWLLASPCESSPLSPGPEWQHPNLVGLPASRKAFCFPGCKDVTLMVGNRAKGRLSSSWNLATLSSSMSWIFKSQRKICQGCQGIGKGERARHLEWEPNCQPHTPPPDCGKTARRRDSLIHLPPGHVGSHLLRSPLASDNPSLPEMMGRASQLLLKSCVCVGAGAV